MVFKVEIYAFGKKFAVDEPRKSKSPVKKIDVLRKRVISYYGLRRKISKLFSIFNLVSVAWWAKLPHSPLSAKFLLETPIHFFPIFCWISSVNVLFKRCLIVKLKTMKVINFFSVQGDPWWPKSLDRSKGIWFYPTDVVPFLNNYRLDARFGGLIGRIWPKTPLKLIFFSFFSFICLHNYQPDSFNQSLRRQFFTCLLSLLALFVSSNCNVAVVKKPKTQRKNSRWTVFHQFSSHASDKWSRWGNQKYFLVHVSEVSQSDFFGATFRSSSKRVVISSFVTKKI